jgi:hypothetical protein
LRARRTGLLIFLLGLVQAEEGENLGEIAAEEPMVLKAAHQIDLVVRVSNSWEEEWVSSFLKMTVSAKVPKP